MAEKNKGFGIVVLMCLGIFVCMIDTTIMNIALPEIQNHLNASLETMSWMLNVYTMSIAVLSIPLARIAEIYGKGNFFIIGSFLFAAGSALCGLSNSGEFLIVSRFIQSIGASILMPISMIIGVSAVPVSKRHLAQGILGSTQGLAAALGPAAGGIITQTIGWSWVFYVNVPICLIAILVGLAKLEMKSEIRQRVKIDFIGFLFSSITIFSLTFVLVKGNTWGWNSTAAWTCYVGSAVTLIVFLIVERKVKDPLVNLALFRHRQFSGASLAMVAATVYMVAVTVLLPQFLTRFQSKTEIQAALLITPVSATIFFIAPISGILARKFGTFLLIVFGFLSLGLSYYLLEHLTLNVTGLNVAAICILLGAGFGFVIGPATTASAADFEGEMLTSSQSVTQMFRQVGVVLAVAIAVSGLTHFLSVQKQEVLRYASSRAEAMNVPSSVKSTVMDHSRKVILNSELNAAPNQQADISPTKAERQKLISANVNQVLSRMPETQREKARGQVTAEVTKNVDASIHAIDQQVKAYSTDMAHHGKESMALSFSKLYQIGFPVVLASVVISFLFVRKRKLSVPDTLVSQGAD